MIFQKLSQILLSDYYAVPDYQRDYEWTDAQTTTLLDDILTSWSKPLIKLIFLVRL